MTEAGPGSNDGPSDLRRRHSAPHSETTLQNGEDDFALSSRDIVPFPVNRAVSDDHQPTLSPPMRADNAVPSSQLMERAARVRVPTDIERVVPHGHLSRKDPADNSWNGRKSHDLDISSAGPTPTPHLPVDMAAAASSGATSSSGMSQPTLGLWSAGPPSKASGISSSSPKNRSRGYSLRRSMFNRTLNVHFDGAGSGIELEEPGPSSHLGTPSGFSNTSSEKGSAAVVTISNTLCDEFLEELPSKHKHKVHAAPGISALPHYDQWLRRKAARSRILRRAKELIERARKTILRIQEIPPSKDGRHIELDASRKKALTDERTGRVYISNTIRSSRYTAWNFVPRQLWAQFSKLANFYFLCVSILQMIPGLSTTGTYTTIVPLLFFVCISIAKEGYDDLRRYRLDKEENNRDGSVLHAYRPIQPIDKNDASSPVTGPIHWATTKWKDIQVGDIVKLERDQAAPADLVLLHSDGDNGLAYIETMALDGETNLKAKQTTPILVDACSTVEIVAACKAHFVVEDPNLDLYNFEGKVAMGGEFVPLTNTEIIYRGSILRNTPEAFGMVIFTGEECKIRMNANKNPRIKAPHLQFVVNRVVIFIVLLVLALAVLCTIAYQVWSDAVEDRAWYLVNAGVAFFPILTSFIIMFNTMIPLSLYVSLEIVKVCQMLLLNDIDMYDEASDTPLEARTSTINEELGQVSYIFTDKTGTLTDNSMKFRKLSVAGTAWLHDTDIKQDKSQSVQQSHKQPHKCKGKKPARTARQSGTPDAATTRRSGVSAFKEGVSVAEEELPPLEDSAAGWKSSARPRKAQPEFRTKDMLRYIQRKPYTVFARKARFFLLSIALCHTCLPEAHDDGSVDFQAASPDELALVRAAQEMGFMLVDRQALTITLKIYPAGPAAEPLLETYEVLNVIEFSSKRKRMSIVVRLPDKRICVFCKGADSIIMQYLKHAALANQKALQIERRASLRKSMEARQAIARKSEHIERNNSIISRPSINMGRGSITLGLRNTSGVPRPSISGSRLQPVPNELHSWLREREVDVDASASDDAVYYNPRPSLQMGGRPSFANSEARSSMQEDEDFDLVDEALVVDESAVFERCFQHINDFATEGLRTLLYGYRFIGEQEYQTWRKVYQDATTSLVDRQNMIEKAGEVIECNLELLGATAIEDKLQKGVPEAIDKLRRANIKMWMLTGDKRETAINIGHSCRLIKDYSAVTVLDHEGGYLGQHIGAAILEINGGRVAHSVVVVDGQTLSIIEADESLQRLFFDLAIITDSVICCRASPSQKAGLVKAIRRKVKKSITLAIGDGANDIAMIQEAHVGIGITGKEGLQAARTSDYSIAQFRFLTKLLLVHGRWNYIRTCKYVVGTFWKEMFFYLTQALYQRWNGWTGTSFYEPWSLSMFNTLFTSLPVIFMGVFEKDLQAATLLAVPELYTKGQRDGAFNFKIYFGWMLMATSEAVIVFFCTLGLYGMTLFTKDQSLFALGDLSFTACVIMISTKMQILEMHNKSITALIAFVLSVGGWFLWNLILSKTYNPHNAVYSVRHGFIHRFGQNALWWLTLLLVLVACIVLELGVGSIGAALWPEDVDVFRELEKDEGVRRRFEEASWAELQQGLTSREDVASRGQGWRRRKAERRQEEREKEVSELLARPRDVGVTDTRRDLAAERRSLDRRKKSVELQEMLGKGFGAVKSE